jgi:ribosomal protein L17
MYVQAKRDLDSIVVVDSLQVDRTRHHPNCKLLGRRVVNPIGKNNAEGYTTTREGYIRTIKVSRRRGT